ncbi:hypothetical protein K461DRAFT_279933 [Myriangium duriaei CBS 260.36]|uniref:Fe2OG dioxygenase domain-containing protein n=1 Tax=Myriangium duriaei CBS 260.36 TaxID=1168546 RepID=A0A9P4IYA7_9PEZI|nr:hypothetical protein K461DRAFT_279933 [Myriangium duriaei CBS 260.36]
MESFVTKKRRRARSPPCPAPTEQIHEEDSTEFKLALLESLHPGLSHDILLDALLESDGDIERASAGIVGIKPPSPPPTKRHKSIGYQSSLASTFLTPSTSDDTDKQPSVPRTLTKKGRTLHLFDPKDVETHTPCSIIHNFLPAQQADALLLELLAESHTFWRGTFQMFERTVTSPHTFCFYVSDDATATDRKESYYYNGGAVADVRTLLPEMRAVSDVVADTVNDEIGRRIRDFYPRGEKLRFQSRLRWAPNACFVNCYAGGAESVGYHADQLTYLGPRAVIGSLSLGVAREFRVRRMGGNEADDGGAIAIHLPHNSLLVMHAEMQEEWKHSIAPAQSIDPHPVAGNKRLNVTYRFYKDSLHPRYTPKCKCGVPACLKSVMKKTENKGRYMWVCDMGYQPGQKACGFFEWANFDDDGEPIWKHDRENG